jgi:hypothetical protein
MIIDLILDRKDGDNVFTENGYKPYTAERFYRQLVEYGEIGFDIQRAFDGGTEQDIKRELCRYIDEQEYNPEIKNYVNSVIWLVE